MDKGADKEHPNSDYRSIAEQHADASISHLRSRRLSSRTKPGLEGRFLDLIPGGALPSSLLPWERSVTSSRVAGEVATGCNRNEIT